MNLSSNRSCRRGSHGPRPRLGLLLTLGLLVAASAASAGEESVLTWGTLVIGSPESEPGPTRGSLVVPGTVIPVLEGPQQAITAAPSDAERAEIVRALASKLTATFRLTHTEIAFSEGFTARTEEVHSFQNPAIPRLQIGVHLLGFDDRTATYQVRFVENGVIIADSKVAAVRGRQTVVGGVDGDEAPYVFLILEPARPEGAPVRVEGDITAPRRLDWVLPQYTEEARKERIQGIVIVQTTIDKNGLVSDARVLKGLPLGLNEAALEAIRQWRFEPATNAAGEPVAVYYNLTINFRLDEKKEELQPPEKAPGGGTL